jgi:predicted neutral ceramidase superfamily lipid hydrolase
MGHHHHIYKKMFTFFITTFIFSIIYYYLGEKHIFYNSSKLSYANTLYFSCMVQTTLGDTVMTPTTYLAKFIVAIQAFSTFIFIT